MKRVLVLVLAGIGGVAVMGVVGIGSLVALHGFRERYPRPKDLSYILGWADLHDAAKIVEVVQSYDSGTNPMVGDKVEAYCLRLDRQLSDLEQKDPETKTWQRGPVSDPLVREALETAVLFARDKASWFPAADVLNSRRFFLSFQQITAYHQRVEAVDMTAYDTETHLLYHAEVRW